MAKYKVTMDVEGTATFHLDAEDETDAEFKAQALLFNAVFPLTVRGKKGLMEVSDVDVDDVSDA